jgi:hypothetical protein
MLSLTPSAVSPAKSTILLAWLVFAAHLVAGVDLAACNANLQQRLDNGTISPNDPIFFFNGTSFMSEKNKLQLTINGCRANCPRPDFDIYGDMFPRLLTWLVPALLLIGNLHIPRIGTMNRILVILHFIGDPIDSTWSLLTKAEIWNRFYAIALRHTPPGPEKEHSARALAALFSAYEELAGDMASVRERFDAIIAESAVRLSREDLDYIIMESAEELVDSRSNEVLRTSLVILNYCWTVLGALVPEIGGAQTSQPGGRIGTAMYLSWLVTVVLLSNTLSGFVSRRTCLRIMERYCRTLKGSSRDTHIFSNSPQIPPTSPFLFAKNRGIPTIQAQPGEGVDVIDAQPWNGSVYSYQPKKRLLSSSASTDKGSLHLLLLSMAPIFAAATPAFVIIWFTPTIGLGCRTLWVVGNTMGLLVSPALTWIIQRVSYGKYAWYFTVVKDALIGIPSVTIIILSSIGLFNTCWCW